MPPQVHIYTMLIFLFTSNCTYMYAKPAMALSFSSERGRLSVVVGMVYTISLILGTIWRDQICVMASPILGTMWYDQIFGIGNRAVRALKSGCKSLTS